VFFIFLGTCDLTAKNGPFMELKSKDESSVHQVFRYIDRFNRFVNVHGSRVVFLEVPPYSILKWNIHRGHRSPQDFIVQDKILSHRIALLNDYIRQINFANQVVSPSFRRPVLRSHTSKRGRWYTTNYGLYSDGVHPSPILARYWLRSVLTAMKTYCRVYAVAR